MKKTAILLLLIFAVSVSVISGCTVTNYNKPVEKYTGPYAEVDGVYSGTDDLGRVLTEKEETTDSERSVRIFYFPFCTICWGCEDRKENLMDCVYGEAPTCGACLWATGKVFCP